MPHHKAKVFAYITYEQRLLVFSHPYEPEAGIQVPAGTLEAGEDAATGVLREAVEETGLSNLVLVRKLGEQRWDARPWGRDEIHQRHFYHLRCVGTPPARWRHREIHLSDGPSEPIMFEFWWADLPHGLPALIADHAAFVPQLLDSLGYTAPALARW